MGKTKGLEKAQDVTSLAKLLAWGFVVAVIVSQGRVELARYQKESPDVILHMQDFALTLLVVVLTIGLIFMALHQIMMARWQMEQAEELANRKDTEMIEAMKALTKELQRRPTAPPSVLNFTLFGKK